MSGPSFTNPDEYEVKQFGRLVELQFGENNAFYIATHELERVTHKWERFVSGGSADDEVLEVETEGGGTIRFLLSNLRFIDDTTRELRRHIRLQRIALKRERVEDVGFDADS